MELDRNGVLIYSRSTKTSLQSMIDVQSNRIDLVVKGYGKDATVDAARIVAGINARTGSFVQIQARQINLTGYVTVSELNAQNAKINNLINGTTQAFYIRSSILSGGRIVLGGHNLGRTTLTIDGVSHNLVVWT